MIRRRPLVMALAIAVALSSCQSKPRGPAAEAHGQQGEQAFLAYCAMCHGDRGAGDGPLAEALAKAGNPRPANLTDATRMTQLGREGVSKITTVGGAHVGRAELMPAFCERLDPAVVDQITEYVITLPSREPEPPSAAVHGYLASPPGVPEEGRRLFVYYCSACHGPYGRGDGPSAEQLRVQRHLRPRDLTDPASLDRKSDEELLPSVWLGAGHAGGAVPAWSGAPAPDQSRSLIAYLRRLSQRRPR